MITIDGGYGEAGGQILRTAVGLSCITGEACRIINIRQKRPKPGLQPQHLKGVEAAAKICSAKIHGAFIGSTTVEFTPGKIKGGLYKIDVETAGAISLVLQTLILPAVYAEKKIEFQITGGTHVNWSPTMDYFQHIFADFLNSLGADILVNIEKYGFYPKGGGRVNVQINPSHIKKIEITERGKFLGNDVMSIASESLRNKNVAERQADAAKERMGAKNIMIKYVPSLSPGSSLHLHAHFENCKLGASALGDIRKKAEDVGIEAAELLKKQTDSGACLDEYMADQILPYMALCESASVSAPATDHARTNIWVIEKFLPIKFEIKDDVIFCGGN